MEQHSDRPSVLQLLLTHCSYAILETHQGEAKSSLKTVYPGQPNMQSNHLFTVTIVSESHRTAQDDMCDKQCEHLTAPMVRTMFHGHCQIK